MGNAHNKKAASGTRMSDTQESRLRRFSVKKFVNMGAQRRTAGKIIP
jgi:hypothetical protein